MLVAYSPSIHISNDDIMDVYQSIEVNELDDVVPEVVATEKIIAKESIEEPIVSMSEEDISLIALITMAEAEGECEEGKRLVIDTILNREL